MTSKRETYDTVKAKQDILRTRKRYKCDRGCINIRH